ncbi:Glutelin [Rhynchospora pubera]|uniref:Glutelin n=1 Tax=Rhynchospora pubera TaxID=906938 RepID=A0AAV8H7X1_9POAL|nr:Glutelin [Rhynchospora pubera]
MASIRSLLSFSLCLLVIVQGCVAQVGVGGQSPWQSSRGFGPTQRACRFEQLSAFEPSRRVQSEAGITEYYEENNEQLRCAGLSALRRIIEPREALGVNQELVRRLQSQNDERGDIVRVEQGLWLLRPTRSQEEHEQPEEYEPERYPEVGYEQWRPHYRGNFSNGLEENFCTLKIRHNINDPNRADIYNPRGGRITRVNSQKLPILNIVQLSATRGVLRRNTLLSPYWNINAHSLLYVTGGLGRVQIVNHQGKTVFDGQLRQKQILLIPQNYVVLKRADRQLQFEWVSFKTNHNAIVNQIVGKASTIRGLPLDVLRASYSLTIEQARRLKDNRREEVAFLTPRYQGTDEYQSEEYNPELQRDIDVSLAQVLDN